MPGDYLEIDQIRESLSRPSVIAKSAFEVLSNISRLVDEGELAVTSQELILRALENRKHFGTASIVLDSLVRQAGLFPYLNPKTLGTADQIAWEFNRPAKMPSDIVFHEPQARIYRALMDGNSVILGAPTSFGKSLVTDAIIASGKFQDVLIVVPTIALIDETRRRLSQRFKGKYKVVTHASQAIADKNLFVLTQERVLERDVIDRAEFVVIDEFYKLSPERAEDERCARLNEVFYRVVKAKKQFYLLGPNVGGISEGSRGKLKCRYFNEEYRTVVSEIHNVNPGKDPLQTLAALCKKLTESTIIFCSSPGSATKVVQALIQSVAMPAHGASEAAEWVAANYHADWHFTKALQKGIGVHHGRIPRSLAHYVVSAFNASAIQFLVCTSTLIEGVNTKAKNVIIFDNKIDKKHIDMFTFNNIKGRAGRMARHYIGHVYLFNPAPSDPLLFVDIPSLSQPDDALTSMLLQMDDEDLTARSKKRLQGFLNQEFLDYETLKANTGIDPQSQIDVAKEIRSNLAKYGPLLQWKGIPNSNQTYGICELLWKPFNCRRLGGQGALSARQLAFQVTALYGQPSTKSLIQKALVFHKDADKAAAQVLDFLRLWATFHFPQLLRALDRIQKDVFRRVRRNPGDYTVYAAKVENLFTDPELVALDEYGIPLEIAKRLAPYLRPFASLDEVLSKLAHLDLARTNLSQFEQALVKDAQNSL
jgi:hypothetical protein